MMLLKAARSSSDEYSPFDQLPHDHAPRRDGWHRMMHFYEDVELCCAQLIEHVLPTHSHGPTTGAGIRARGTKREHAPCHRGDRGAPTGLLRELPEQEPALPSGLPGSSRRAVVGVDRKDPREGPCGTVGLSGAGKVVRFTKVKNRVRLPYATSQKVFFIQGQRRSSVNCYPRRK